jgi:hypothetical protein
MAPGPAKRSFRNLLIDRKFQMKWMWRTIIAASLVVSVLGVFLFRTVSAATDQIVAQKLGDPALTSEATEAFVAAAQQDKRTTIVQLVAGLALLVLLIGVLTILSTHKIAGPAYKIRKLCLGIDGDHLQVRGKLRKADELQETFVEFDDMLRRLRDHRRQDLQVLENAKNLLAKAGSKGALEEEFDELIERYRESIKMQ